MHICKCRVLFGELQALSYDWVGGRPRGQGASAEAVRLAKGPASAGDVLSLFPDSGGNVHSFKASKPSAMIDVLVPGYVGGVCCAFASTSWTMIWIVSWNMLRMTNGKLLDAS